MAHSNWDLMQGARSLQYILAQNCCSGRASRCVIQQFPSERGVQNALWIWCRSLGNYTRKGHGFQWMEWVHLIVELIKRLKMNETLDLSVRSSSDRVPMNTLHWTRMFSSYQTLWWISAESSWESWGWAVVIGWMDQMAAVVGELCWVRICTCYISCWRPAAKFLLISLLFFSWCLLIESTSSSSAVAVLGSEVMASVCENFGEKD